MILSKINPYKQTRGTKPLPRVCLQFWFPWIIELTTREPMALTTLSTCYRLALWLIIRAPAATLEQVAQEHLAQEPRLIFFHRPG